jgi:tetratricopeptide (TPR) repeat protein
MPEKTVADLPRDLRELYQKGVLAVQRHNFDYAIAIFNQVLQREPGFYDCRAALRAAQMKKSSGGTSFFKRVLGGASASPLVAKAQLAMRKDPLESMQIAEQILGSDPNSSSALRILAEAALAADMPRTACFTYEVLLKNSPKDYHLMMDYGQALAKAGQVGKAEGIYAELQRLHPNKGEITQALKNLSANRTLQEGGYDALATGEGSYRDILKNKEEAIALEQEKREVKTDDVTANLIREYETRLAREPENLKLMRNLAELYAQKKEFEKSLEYYERIRTSGKGGDPSLERAIAETAVRRFEHRIAQLDPNAADYAAQAAAIQAERVAFQLAECKSRAERYPTDLQIRFELGALYFQNGQYSEAIQEFQKAQNNPHRRLQAMSYLGQCFAARGMNDLAARKLQEALKEKASFDDEKKELLYTLGNVFEKMGKREEAIEQFKQIYEVDIGYRDVSAKVDAYYAAQ